MGQPVIRDDPPLGSCVLADCQEAVVLLKHDPITNYPFWARWLLYFTYWLTEYSGEAQIQAVCTTEARAEELVEDAGYRGIWTPVDESLPAERCQWKPAIHFKSPLRDRYRNYKPKLIAVPHMQLDRGLEQVEDGLKNLDTLLKT